MVCVAVTRGGFGDVWLFDTRAEAYLHPLVQYGDALLTCGDDVRAQYNWLEWRSLRELAGLDPHLPRADTPRTGRIIQEAQCGVIFDALVGRASRPPSDSQQICDMVSRDRRLGQTMASKKKGVEFPREVVAEREKAERAPPPAGVRGPKNVPLGTVICMGTDKHGCRYGPDNNPKKAGSKTHGRFALYVDGMSVQQALDAGIETADIVYDREHGFITLGESLSVEETIAERVAEDFEAAE